MAIRTKRRNPKRAAAPAATPPRAGAAPLPAPAAVGLLRGPTIHEIPQSVLAGFAPGA